jgi:hypothetical protein
VSGAAKILSGPAGYAVPLIVGGILLYVVYKAIKDPTKQFVQDISGPAPGQTWANYLFGIGAPFDPNPSANADMGGVNFGAVNPSTWNGP